MTGTGFFLQKYVLFPILFTKACIQQKYVGSAFFNDRIQVFTCLCEQTTGGITFVKLGCILSSVGPMQSK